MKHLTLFVLCFMLVVSGYAETETPELEPIVVTATRDESLIENYPGSVQVITRQDIEQTPAKDIAELLKIVAGVEVYKRGNQNYEIDLRGFNNGGGNGKRMLLLINGIPAKNGDSGKQDWYIISIEEIEKIEIIRGNMGSVYGDAAISGVINIITVAAKSGSNSFIELDYGSYNKAGVSLNISERLNRGFYSIKAVYDISDGYRKKDEYEKKNFAFSIANFYKNTKLNADINYGVIKQSYPGSLKEEEIQKYGETYEGSWVTLQDYNILMISGAINHYYNPVTDLKINLGYKNREYAYPPNPPYITKNYNLYINFHRKIFLIKKQLVTDIFSGIDLGKEEIKIGKGVEIDRKISAFYLRTHFNLFKRLIFTADYRYDLLENLYSGNIEYKKIYRMNSYKIGSLFKIYKENSLYLAYSEAFRTPTCDEILKYEYDSSYVITNISGLENIKPERAINYELGIRAFPAQIINFNITLFHMDVKDEILYTGSVNTNFPEIIHRGIETSLNMSPMPMIKLNINYTFQHIYFAKGKYKNNIVPLSPKHIISAGISIYPINGLSILHLTRWRDKCYAVNDLNNEFPKLKSYAVSDLKINYRMKKIKFSFNIYNLYNERYSEYAGVGYDWITSTYYIGYYPSSRRNYTLSATLYF